MVVEAVGGPQLRAFITSTLMLDATHWRPSLKSEKASRGDNLSPRSPWLRAECSVSTQLLLGLLVWWSTRLYKCHKDNAAALLKQVLEAWLPSVVNTVVVDGAPVRGGCPATTRTDFSCCKHADRLARLYLEDTAVSTHKLPALLMALCAAKRCAAMDAWLGRIVHRLCRVVDARVRVNTWPRQPHGIESPGGKVRRRRVDAEIRTAALDAVKAKRHRSTQAAARSGQFDMSDGSARECNQILMQQYLRNTHEIFQSDSSISLSFDGARLGGEETLLTCAYTSRGEVAAWLPPQALHEGASHGSVMKEPWVHAAGRPKDG